MVVFNNNNNGFHTAFYFNKKNQHFQIASINLFFKTFKNHNESLVRLKYLIYQYTTSVCLSLHSKLRSRRFYYFTVMKFYGILTFSSVLTLIEVILCTLYRLSVSFNKIIVFFKINKTLKKKLQLNCWRYFQKLNYNFNFHSSEPNVLGSTVTAVWTGHNWNTTDTATPCQHFLLLK